MNVSTTNAAGNTAFRFLVPYSSERIAPTQRESSTTPHQTNRSFTLLQTEQRWKANSRNQQMRFARTCAQPCFWMLTTAPNNSTDSTIPETAVYNRTAARIGGAGFSDRDHIRLVYDDRSRCHYHSSGWNGAVFAVADSQTTLTCPGARHAAFFATDSQPSVPRDVRCYPPLNTRFAWIGTLSTWPDTLGKIRGEDER